MWAYTLVWLRVQNDDEILLKHTFQEEEEKKRGFKNCTWSSTRGHSQEYVYVGSISWALLLQLPLVT